MTLGGLVLSIASLWAMADISLHLWGHKSNGIVTKLVAHQGENPKDVTYSPIVEYTDHSGTRQVLKHAMGADPLPFGEGDKVSVVYFSPHFASIDTFPFLFGFQLILALGSLFFIGTGFLFLYFEKTQKSSQTLEPTR